LACTGSSAAEAGFAKSLCALCTTKDLHRINLQSPVHAQVGQDVVVWANVLNAIRIDFHGSGSFWKANIKSRIISKAEYIGIIGTFI